MSCRRTQQPRRIPISQARRTWSVVVRLVLRRGETVLITRYGSPWVLLVRAPPRLQYLLSSVGAAIRRPQAGRYLTTVARRVREETPVLVISSGRAVVLLPADGVCQN